ncbi:MAG: YdeI/OmpD-associated family protein [Deltaproteobacteria bacterium]
MPTGGGGRGAPRDEIPVPHDLQIELHDDSEAAAAFAALPPSHRREYIDWILEARRPETRARRVEETARRVKRPRA